MSEQHEAVVAAGPIGGPGGVPGATDILRRDEYLSSIVIHWGLYVDGIEFRSRDRWGVERDLGGFGGTGSRKSVIGIDDGEQVVELAGRLSRYVDSLMVRTDRKQVGPVGGAGGDLEFSLEVPLGCELVGVFGRAGQYVDALGLYLRRAGHSDPAWP